jgi:hypothetical protein
MPVEVKDSDINDIVGTILPNTADNGHVVLKGGSANTSGQGFALQLERARRAIPPDSGDTFYGCKLAERYLICAVASIDSNIG